jgi:hypothetical protein
MKVKNTLLHEIRSSFIGIGGFPIRTSNEVLVAEVQLVILQCNVLDAVLYKHVNAGTKGYHDNYVLQQDIDHHSLFNYNGFKPIFISHTEKIENGDKYVNEKLEEYTMTDVEWADNNNGWYGNKRFKVMIQPDQLAPETLHAISVGDLKYLDKVLVECERKMTDPCSNPNCAPDGSRCSKKGLLEVCESRFGEETVIKLNPLNHVILYKQQEKMVPLSVVESAYYAHLNNTYKDSDFKEWFKLNYPLL